MSIITNEEKGSQISAVEMSDNFKYIASALAAYGISPKDFDPLTGDIWRLDEGSNFRKLQLTADLNLFTEGGLPTGVYILDVKQPANGSKTLTIDNNPILLHPLEVTRVTVIVGAYGKEYDSNVTKADLAPRILSQAKSQTAIVGGLVQFWLRGLNIKKVRVYKDGKQIAEQISPSFQFRMVQDENGKYPEGAYQFELESVDGQTEWSDEMFAVLGEAEAAYLISGPQNVTVDAGQQFQLSLEAGGTPSPFIRWYKLVNGIRVSISGATGNTFSAIAIDTKTLYQAEITNKFMVDGEYVVNTIYTEPVTVTANKNDQDAPEVTMDDNTPESYLQLVLTPGIDIAEYEGTVDATLAEPVTLGLTSEGRLIVGDFNLPVGKAGIRKKESALYKPSPWATNQQAFTGSIQPFTAFVDDPLDYVIQSNRFIALNQFRSLGTTKVLPRTIGAYIEGVVEYGSGNNCHAIVLTPTNAISDLLEQLPFAIYGYQGKASYVTNKTTVNTQQALTEQDKERLEVVDNNGVISLAYKVYHGGVWATLVIIPYPDAMWIQFYSLAGNLGMTTTGSLL